MEWTRFYILQKPKTSQWRVVVNLSVLYSTRLNRKRAPVLLFPNKITRERKIESQYYAEGVVFFNLVRTTCRLTLVSYFLPSVFHERVILASQFWNSQTVVLGAHNSQKRLKNMNYKAKMKQPRLQWRQRWGRSISFLFLNRQKSRFFSNSG